MCISDGIRAGKRNQDEFVEIQEKGFFHDKPGWTLGIREGSHCSEIKHLEQYPADGVMPAKQAMLSISI